jgi:hypothetical protein
MRRKKPPIWEKNVIYRWDLEHVDRLSIIHCKYARTNIYFRRKSLSCSGEVPNDGESRIRNYSLFNCQIDLCGKLTLALPRCHGTATCLPQHILINTSLQIVIYIHITLCWLHFKFFTQTGRWICPCLKTFVTFHFWFRSRNIRILKSAIINNTYL